MEKSIYADLIARVFPKLGSVVETVNEKRNGAKELTYLHKQMLRVEYSPDQKWESANVNSNFVSADLVAMDSPVPLKKRPALSHADGTIPKIAVGYALKESQINALDLMIQQGRPWQQIAAKIAQDPVSCSVALDEANERNFLQAISDGYTSFVVKDDENNKVELLRVDFKYKPENTYATKEKGKVDRDDIENVITAITDNLDSCTAVMIDKGTYNALRKTRWAKELVADSTDRNYTDSTLLPVPSKQSFDDAVEQEWGFKFIIVDRTIREERDGKQTKVRPFNKNRLVFLPTDGIQGALVWGALAEMSHPVGGAQYTIVDKYKLISRYRAGNPLRELTAGQAMVLPVIENVDQIYILDLDLANEVNEEEENKDSQDTKITVFGETYVKATFVELLKSEFDVDVEATASDKAVLEIVNALSQGEQAKLKELADESAV